MKQLYTTIPAGRGRVFWSADAYLFDLSPDTEAEGRRFVLECQRRRTGSKKLHIITDDIDFGLGMIDDNPNEIFFGRLKVEFRTGRSAEQMPPCPPKPYNPDVALWNWFITGADTEPPPPYDAT